MHVISFGNKAQLAGKTAKAGMKQVQQKMAHPQTAAPTLQKGAAKKPGVGGTFDRKG